MYSFVCAQISAALASLADLSPQQGVSFSFAEGDLACGAGAYRLTSVRLGISGTLDVNSSVSADFANARTPQQCLFFWLACYRFVQVSLSVSLFSADDSGLPQSSLAFFATLITVPPAGAPVFVAIGLPATFVLDVSTDPLAKFSIVFLPSVQLKW
jgi:hypothetical protein